MGTVSKQKGKFLDPNITYNGEKRARVNLSELRTLWFNTGTLCNFACSNCYIESTPKNDRLVYLTLAEVVDYLREIESEGFPTKEIGITGGEPFMNPDIIPIMEECLRRKFYLLVLTNATRPMMKCNDELLRLKDIYGLQLTIRISVDHFKHDLHEEERGTNSWKPMMVGLKWLSDNGFHIAVAGRTRWGEEEGDLRHGFASFFKKQNINIDAFNKRQLVLFPEMDESEAVPEITTECWSILDVSPDDMMCASSRMVVKRKGKRVPEVMACTLLAYNQQFNLGKTLKEATNFVYLNHPYCSKFCVLGGGTCCVNE